MRCDTKRAWPLFHSYFLKSFSLHCHVKGYTTSLCFDLNLNHWQTFWVVDHTKSCIRANHFRLSTPNDAKPWKWSVILACISIPDKIRLRAVSFCYSETVERSRKQNKKIKTAKQKLRDRGATKIEIGWGIVSDQLILGGGGAQDTFSY